MRNYNYIIPVLALTVLLNACTTKKRVAKDSNSPTIENPYFGQKPPGLTPELFAPGVISLNGRYEYGISFSPDLDEVYYSGNKKGGVADIYFSKLEGKKWTDPKKANFTKGEKEEEMQPFVSFNGNMIYFVAYNADNTDSKIWYVTRLEDSWSDAKRLESPINNDEIFYPNQAKNGDIYYTNISDFTNIKINSSPNKNDKYPKVQEVNIEFGIHAYIAPSQDYLLVNARNKEDEARKDNDIYVCFKEKDGTWTEPINLGDAVNSTFGETCPIITKDGKYIFFSRYNEDGGLSNIYWVSAEVINNVRPVNL